MLVRGKEREATLDASVYFSDQYFALHQLFSLSHQIHEINKLKPRDILEIGPGNGFTSTFLKRAGYDVTTVDINPSLHPDICAPLDQLPEHLNGRRFDLVVCCEVLEHMPLSELPSNLRYLRGAGERLFMTLPNYKRTIGIGAMFRIPGRKPFPASSYIEIKKRKLQEGAHFWEVGSEPGCTRASIVAELKKLYSKAHSGRFAFNPYHLSFYAR